MAHRDTSQGFAFVYLNLKKLLSEVSQSQNNIDSFSDDTLENTKSGQVLNFNKDPIVKKTASKEPHAPNSLNEIKNNLDRLQSLHHKLHTILTDLEKVSKKPKKK